MKHLFYLLLFSIALHTYAQDEIECDRPDQNETPALVPAGFFQVEMGFAYEKESPEQQNMIYPAALLKYGLANIAELRLEIENTTERVQSEHGTMHQTGIKPIAFGMKLKISEERKSIPKTSVIIMASIPMLASKNFQDKYPSPEIRFTMQHSLTDKISLGYNLGGLCRGEDFTPVGLYTLTTDFELTKQLHSYIEVYGFIPYRDKQEHHLDGGFTYIVANNVMFDIEAGFDLDKHPGWFCGTGISFRLPR